MRTWRKSVSSARRTAEFWLDESPDGLFDKMAAYPPHAAIFSMKTAEL